jgi:hypothetical protein
MSITNNFMNLFHNPSRITFVITLVSLLTIGMTIQSLPQSNALDINELGNFEGLPDIGLSNNCVAFECNNQQTVDNRKTISDNTNSNIISESDNTDIGATHGSSSQSDGSSQPLICVQCFENANLTPEQQTDLFSIIPGQPDSFEELCPLIQNSSAANFELVLIEGAFLTQDQAEALVDCLVEAGILVE